MAAGDIYRASPRHMFRYGADGTLLDVRHPASWVSPTPFYDRYYGNSACDENGLIYTLATVTGPDPTYRQAWGEIYNGDLSLVSAYWGLESYNSDDYSISSLHDLAFDWTDQTFWICGPNFAYTEWANEQDGNLWHVAKDGTLLESFFLSNGFPNDDEALLVALPKGSTTLYYTMDERDGGPTPIYRIRTFDTVTHETTLFFEGPNPPPDSNVIWGLAAAVDGLVYAWSGDDSALRVFDGTGTEIDQYSWDNGDFQDGPPYQYFTRIGLDTDETHLLISGNDDSGGDSIWRINRTTREGNNAPWVSIGSQMDPDTGNFYDYGETTGVWAGFTAEPPPPPEPPACPTYTVWYSWVAPGDGLGSFHGVGGAGGTHPSDPTLSVQLDAFTGPDLAGLEPVGTGGDTLNFFVSEGETYYIRVNSVNAFEFGPFTLEWVFTEESLPVPAARVLGCSQHVAYIQSKCNGARLCELLDASALGYDRRLDDISEAFVEIPISGDADEACCACLKDVEPWCHVLTIVREGDGVVWTGPVQKVTYGYEKVRIEAKDKLAWLQVRVNELTIDQYENNTTVSMTTIAKTICEVAMDDDGDSPCFMDCVIEGPGGDGYAVGVERKFIFDAFEGPTAYDDFSSLGQAGIDFTVINQCLILTSEQLPDGAIGTLLDEHIVGDISVVKDGATFGNRFFVRYEGDDEGACAPPADPCPAVAEVTEAEQGCYGAVERLIPNDLGINSHGTAATSAEAFLNASKAGSRRIEFPDGTQLSPDTPWLINDMIPGQRVDVALSKTCFPVYQSFKLQHVSVEDDVDGERISIDLKALNQTP